ncbi:MAG: acetylglutamate kinase [Rhodothermales bacterium]
MPLFILYIDDYHQGDTLFLRGLAGQVREGSVPTMIVHGGGEAAERHLEANGFFPERGADGQWQNLSPLEHTLVEQATRMANRTLTSLFNDHVVSVVGVQGTDRKLVQVDEAGAITLGRTKWLMDWAEKRVVPIISALGVAPDGATVLLPTEQVVEALCQRFADANPMVAMFSKKNRQGLEQGGAQVPEWNMSTLPPQAHLQAPEAARWLVQRGAHVLVTSPTGLYRKPTPNGTRLVADRV